MACFIKLPDADDVSPLASPPANSSDNAWTSLILSPAIFPSTFMLALRFLIVAVSFSICKSFSPDTKSALAFVKRWSFSAAAASASAPSGVASPASASRSSTAPASPPASEAASEAAFPPSPDTSSSLSALSRDDDPDFFVAATFVAATFAAASPDAAASVSASSSRASISASILATNSSFFPQFASTAAFSDSRRRTSSILSSLSSCLVMLSSFSVRASSFAAWAASVAAFARLSRPSFARFDV
mmetsp:Transcript_124837/g.303200  ORF Transcript_124837/g.303200 Transcript_124837/m.303200 type:complete len:245 (-) Transcript_124837:600-1334(-)